MSLIAIVKTVVDEESLFSTARMTQFTQSPKPAPNNARNEEHVIDHLIGHRFRAKSTGRLRRSTFIHTVTAHCDQGY